MIILNKIFHFCAAHKYHNPALSEEENLRAFGDDLRLHGHNYTLTISVTGAVDPATGFLVDLQELAKVVQHRVIDKLDHSCIHEDLAWFRDRQPSTENLVQWIWQELAPRMPGCRLLKLRLEETPTIFTEFDGKLE